MQEMMKQKAAQLLKDGTVDRVLAWKSGETFYDVTPAVFNSEEELDKLVFNCFCGSNLSKYLIEETRKDGKILVFLKPCDSYSFNELLAEHRIDREKIYAVGIKCCGNTDAEKLREAGAKGLISAECDEEKVTVKTLYGEKVFNKEDVLLEKCKACKGSKHVAFDELLCTEEDENARAPKERFGMVEKLEAMTPDERFEFWRGELSKCIRCNACRNVCPACSCRTCIFDNEKAGLATKANNNSFEEKFFHIIRAFHVAGRCTDCGECSRVCPQGIPLHLINRKFIKDINELYGDHQAGSVADFASALIEYKQDDCEPSIVMTRGEGKK